MSRKKEKHKKNKTLSAKPSLTVVPSRDGVDLRATQHSPVAPKGSNATSYAGVGRTGMQAATNLRPIAEVADKPEPSGFPKLIQALELFRDQQNQPCAVLKTIQSLMCFTSEQSHLSNFSKACSMTNTESFPHRRCCPMGFGYVSFCLQGK